MTFHSPDKADSAALPIPISRQRPKSLRLAWLAALVQMDAFSLNPLRYLQAVVWRLRGLRLRARNSFAALAGRSPRAYDLWMARKEPAIIQDALADGRPSSTEIVPVIDCTRSVQNLERTLRSLKDAGVGGKPLLLSGPAISGSKTVGNPKEIFAHLGQDRWVCVVSCGDVLSPSAIEIYRRAIADSPPYVTVIYADDDLIDASGKRRSPHFKPSWNPELFEHHDFISGSAIVKTDAAMADMQFGDDWQLQIIRRAAGQSEPMHLPFVLHHRRWRPRPLRSTQSEIRESGPLVTVIIPTRNREDLLRTCIDGLRRTSYQPAEITVVDNGSDDPRAIRYLEELAANGVQVLGLPGPFNYSALNNRAVADARGDLLCFLNNDVEIIDPDWLGHLVREAMKPDRGAAGARLLYPDRSIQHAGVVLGVGGGAGHAHRLVPIDDPGYFERAALPQRTSAVTAACMVVSREKFLAVGGFDEVQFPVAFNDVDLCLKLNQQGWQSFYEPNATLIHHESKSRGTDRDKVGRKRLAKELAALKQKWHTDRVRDPFHHVHLSPFTEQFVIAI